jgi:hypothetical protein
MSELSDQAKRAYLMHEHIVQMRANAQHISSLDGIKEFVEMFNATAGECRELLAADPIILESIRFLQPIRAETKSSEYPAAIIDGKRGQFMVNSSILLSALKSFVKFHLPPEEREKLAFD